MRMIPSYPLATRDNVILEVCVRICLSMEIARHDTRRYSSLGFDMFGF